MVSRVDMFLAPMMNLASLTFCSENLRSRIMFIQRMPLATVKTVSVSVEDSLANAVNDGDSKKLRALLSNPAVDVNAMDADGCTALMCAVKAGEWDAVDILLADGRVDVNIKDCAGWTALMYAAVSEEDFFENFLDGLDERGVDFDLNLTNDENQSALILAARKSGGGDVRLLLGRGADVNIVDKSGSNALMHYIKSNGDDVDAGVVQWFVENNVDVSCQDIHGHTALMLLSGQFGRDAKKVFLENEMVLHNIDAVDGRGSTALMHAVVDMDYDYFELLVDAGADVNVQVNGAWSARSLAQVNQYHEFVKLIDSVNDGRNRLSDID